MKADMPVERHKDLEICIGKKNEFPREVVTFEREKKTKAEYIKEFKEAEVKIFDINHLTITLGS